MPTWKRVVLWAFLSCVLPLAALPQSKESSSDESGSVKAAPHRRVRLGGILVSAGYTHYSGPFYYPYGPYGCLSYGYCSPFYDWAWYNPFFHPGYYSGFARSA